jgi:hypothetical protein
MPALAGQLKLQMLTPVNPARGWKGIFMWVYDGEQWIEESVTESTPKPEQTPRPEDMVLPELQVVQIVPVPVPRTNHVPPFPLP